MFIYFNNHQGMAYTIQIWKSINSPTKSIKIDRSLITVIFSRILLFIV